MSIIFLKGKQFEWFPEKKDQVIQIPLQKKIVESGKKKEVDPGDKIVIDKVLEKDGKFGQPFLPIKLIGEVIRNVRKKKNARNEISKEKKDEKNLGL